MDCVFCKIVSGEIPSKKVFENEDVLAFYDTSPMASVHVLIIPKKHIAASAADINSENSYVVAKIFEAASIIAKELKLDQGFRIVTNSGENACQTVPHLHFHLLGGQQLGIQMC